mgnify:CR=1 FL=1
MGMESVIWGTDPQGIADGGNGLIMSARDAAKFGQLFLHGGIWNGRQLVPADWATESTTVKNNGAGDGTGAYGYQWWIRSFGNTDTYYAFGAWGQLERDGKTYSFGKTIDPAAMIERVSVS